MTDRISMLLSLQRALLGEVTPELRAVTAMLGEDHIFIKMIFERPPTEDEVEDMQVVGSNVAADFYNPVMVSEQVEHLPPDVPLVHEQGWDWVYRRKEADSPWLPGPWYPPAT